MEKYVFCNACGSPNPDGSAFCSACGKPLAVPQKPQQTAEPVSQPDSFTQPANTVSASDFRSYFRRSWREFAASPYQLVMVILYSVSFLISAYNAFDFLQNTNQWASLFRSFGQNGAIDTMQGWVTLGVMLGMIPETLTTIGLWLIYGDAASRSESPIKTVGLTMVRSVQIIYMVVFWIGAAAILFGSCAGAEAAGEYMDDSAKVGMLLLFTLIFGFLFTSILLKTKFISAARWAADYCIPDSGCAKGLAVFQFIEAAFIFIGILAAPNMRTLACVLMCAMSVMFGVLLLRYHETMEYLLWKRKSFNNTTATNFTARQTSNEGQWRCRCGRIHQKYETSCTCGLLKADVQTGN